MRSQTRHVTLLALVCLLALLAVACGGSNPALSPTVAVPAPTTEGGALATTDPATLPTAPAAPEEGAYPAPDTAAVGEAYPSEGAAGAPLEEYPAPAVEEAFLEPRFRIDQPITAATTTVTGQAPPNLSLVVLDVTYNGALLGQGQSDANGAFAIPVSGLTAGNRIGITLGELPEGMDLVLAAETYFPHRGEGFQNLPNVGVFYDTALVQ
jgi:hypothetical protein